MTFFHKLSCCFMLFLFTTTLYAGNPGWTSPSKITKIVVTGGGGINVALSPPLAGCVPQAGYGPSYATLYKDHPGINTIQSVLFTAYTTGKEVSLYFVDDKCKFVEVVMGGAP